MSPKTIVTVFVLAYVVYAECRPSTADVEVSELSNYVTLTLDELIEEIWKQINGSQQASPYSHGSEMSKNVVEKSSLRINVWHNWVEEIKDKLEEKYKKWKCPGSTTTYSPPTTHSPRTTHSPLTIHSPLTTHSELSNNLTLNELIEEIWKQSNNSQQVTPYTGGPEMSKNIAKTSILIDVWDSWVEEIRNKLEAKYKKLKCPDSATTSFGWAPTPSTTHSPPTTRFPPSTHSPLSTHSPPTTNSPSTTFSPISTPSPTITTEPSSPFSTTYPTTYWTTQESVPSETTTVPTTYAEVQE